MSEKQKDNAGMTFIEIIVVLGIFTAISATVLFNYRDFSSGVKLQNLSQEIALQGKRAQTLASQGRRPVLSPAQMSNIEEEGNDDFLPADWVSSYGLAFDTEGHPESFIFYFNSPIYYSSTYDPDEGDMTLLAESRNPYFHDYVDGSFGQCGDAVSECVEEFLIADGSYIDLLCKNAEPADDPDCTGENDSGGSPTSQLYISFTRPFLDAYIMDESTEKISHGFVRVSSSDGSQKRYVTFWSTGQISVR